MALLLLAWASISISGENHFFGHIDGAFDVVANLLLLPGLGIGHLMNGTAWSISTELLAYLLFPLLIAGGFSSNRFITAIHRPRSRGRAELRRAAGQEAGPGF